MSCASTLLRPGVQLLMQEAMVGKFEVLYAEALDRICRDQEDIAAIYKRLNFSGVKIVTLAEGEISKLHIGLKGTMNVLLLKDLADKTRRGLRGRVEKGKSGGGKACGYDVVHAINANGEPITGERRINDVEAKTVRRIFDDYIAGKSPKAIAVQLNKDGLPGPSGKDWGQSTINGNRYRGTGILNNELDVGRMVWNRLRYIKDPDTGKRISRLNPEEDWVVQDVPELRIIDQLTWEAVKAKQGDLTAKGPELWKKNRPKNLFSGLIKCGCCGGGFSMISQTHLGCSTARNKGTCDNRLSIKRTDVEASVLGALKVHLMDEELCAEFCREYTRHQNDIRSRHNAALNSYPKEMETLKRDQEKLVQSILDGVPGSALKEKGEYIVRRQEELEAILASTDEAPVLFHPSMA